MRQIQGMLAYMNNPCVQMVTPAAGSQTAASFNAGVPFPVRIALKSDNTSNGIPIDGANFELNMTVAVSSVTGAAALEATRFKVNATSTISDGEVITVAGQTFEFRHTGSVTAGHITVDAGSATATAAAGIAALLSKINTRNVLSLSAASQDSTTLILRTPDYSTISETMAHGTAVVAPTLDKGVADVQVLPSGTWVAAETCTVTVGSVTAPDGRTITANNTSVTTTT